MKKSLVAKLLVGLPGFRKLGSFHIGECNGEVISGYALDAPPGGLYIWRFVLPAYDGIDFLHMSLGKRIAAFAAGDERAESSNLKDLELLLRNDWTEFSSIRDAESLLRYVEREQCVGDYSEWTRYLAHIRAGQFESASLLEVRWQNSGWVPRLQPVADNMKTALEAKSHSGWTGVQRLLVEWSKSTVAKFCR